jgi:hypothetical protein
VAGRPRISPERTSSKSKYRLVRELADDSLDLTVACRLLDVSRSGYHEWKDRPSSARDIENEIRLKHIEPAHAESRGTYGITPQARRVNHGLE